MTATVTNGCTYGQAEPRHAVHCHLWLNTVIVIYISEYSIMPTFCSFPGASQSSYIEPELKSYIAGQLRLYRHHNKQMVTHTYWHKNWWNCHFSMKSPTEIYFKVFCVRWKFMLFSAILSFTCSQLRGTYMRAAILIRVNRIPNQVVRMWLTTF